MCAYLFAGLCKILKIKWEGSGGSLGDCRTPAHVDGKRVGQNADGWCGWGSRGWQPLIGSKHSSSDGGIFRGSTVEMIGF